jgi:glycosyltransferase involved in cell wall biosynthesis
MVRREGVEERVLFLGHVPHAEMPKYLKISDIFIRPSLSEGMGNSFIEAMCAGLPVIATSVGGIPDFLKDRETGLFCEVGNPESIAERIKELIGDPMLKEKLVLNSQKMVREKYDWSLVAGDMRKKVLNF